ncbi:MAG: RNA polymerase sigma factor [Calditrichaceae bacterium]
MTELELIDQLKTGDTKALKSLMQMHQDYVFTIAMQMVRKKEAAEELTQDVFVKAYYNIQTYEGRGKFTTWLYKIVYNTCLNYLRKKQIVYTAGDLEKPGINNDENSELMRLWTTKSAEQIEPELENSNLQSILWAAIDRLPLIQSLVISMYYLNEFSVSEIAGILEIPHNTIKTHLFRGRSQMREILLSEFTTEELM